MPTNNQKYLIKFKVDTSEFKEALSTLESMLLNIKNTLNSLPTESLNGISKDIARQIQDALSNVGMISQTDKSNMLSGLEGMADNARSAIDLLGKSKGAQSARLELEKLIDTIEHAKESTRQLQIVKAQADIAVTNKADIVTEQTAKKVEEIQSLIQRIKETISGINAQDYLQFISEDKAAIDAAQEPVESLKGLAAEFKAVKKEIEKPFDLTNLDDIKRAFDMLLKGEKFYSLDDPYKINDIASVFGVSVDDLETFEAKYTDLVKSFTSGYSEIIKKLHEYIDTIRNADQVTANGLSINNAVSDNATPNNRKRNSTVTVKVKYDAGTVEQDLNNTLAKLKEIAASNPVSVSTILVNDTYKQIDNSVELDIKYNYEKAESDFSTTIVEPLRKFASTKKIQLPIDFDELTKGIREVEEAIAKAEKEKRKRSTRKVELSAKAKAELAGETLTEKPGKENVVIPKLGSPAGADIEKTASNIIKLLQLSLDKNPVFPQIAPPKNTTIETIKAYTSLVEAIPDTREKTITLSFVPNPENANVIDNIAAFQDKYQSINIPISLSVTPSIDSIKTDIDNLIKTSKGRRIPVKFAPVDKTIDSDEPILVKPQLSPDSISATKKEFTALLNNLRNRKPILIKTQLSNAEVQDTISEFQSKLQSLRDLSKESIQVQLSPESMESARHDYTVLLNNLRNRKPIQIRIELSKPDVQSTITEFENKLKSLRSLTRQPIDVVTKNKKSISFSSSGASTVNKNVKQTTEILAESEPIFRHHRQMVEEIFTAESQSISGVISQLNILNQEINNGVKQLTLALKEIKAWAGNTDRTTGIINTDAIEANISALTATISNLDLSQWSDKNKTAIEGLIQKVDDLGNAYRLTGRFNEYKTALQSLSGPIKDIIKDEQKLQEAVAGADSKLANLKVERYSSNVQNEYLSQIDNLKTFVDKLNSGALSVDQFNSVVNTMVSSLTSMMDAEDGAARQSENFNSAVQKVTNSLRNYDVSGYSDTLVAMYNDATRSASEYESQVRSGGQTLEWYSARVTELIRRLTLQRNAEDKLAQSEQTRQRNENRKETKRREDISGKTITQLANLENYIDRISAGKIGLFGDRVNIITRDVRELGNALIAMCSNGENGIGEINEAASQFGTSIRDTFTELKTLASDKSFNIFNGVQFDNTGTVVGERISSITQAQQLMQQIVDSQTKIYDAQWTQGRNGESAWLQWSGAVKNAHGEIERLVITYDELNGTVRASSSAAKENITMWGALTSQINKAVGNLINYVSVILSAHRIVSAIREGVGYVRELDSALASLSLVTKASDAEISRFTTDARVMADAVASTTTEVVKSATEWARLGYSMNDALELAGVSAKLAKGGFMELTDATSQLTSSLQAFYSTDLRNGIISAGDAATLISDKLINIGNNFAITSEGIGSSLQRSAAAMVAAGNDIDKTIALTTAANVITQNPDSIGNALKVISMRLRGTNASAIAEEIGESVDGLDTSFSKLYATIKELTSVKANDFQGISILTDSGAYKDTYQILLEISEIWDQLSDASQAALLETMAGKTRGAVVAGILQNGQVLKEAYEASTKSVGATADAVGVALDTIEAKQARLSNQTQAFWQDLINSEDAKRVIDALTTVVELLDKLINSSSKLGAMGSLVPIFSMLGGTTSLLGSLKHGVDSNTGLFRLASSGSVSMFGQTIGSNSIGRHNGKRYGSIGLGGSIVSGKEIATLSRINDEVNDTLANYATRADAVTAALDRLSVSEERLSAGGVQILSSIRNSENALDGFRETSQRAAASVTTFSTTLKSFGAALVSSLASGAISALIGFGISAAIQAIDDYVHRYEKNIETAKKLSAEFQEQAKVSSEVSGELDKLKPRYDELSKGVDKYGNNISLTSAEYKEYKDIVAQIIEISPSVQNSIREETDALGEKIDMIDAAKKAQDEYNRSELRSLVTGSNGAARAAGISARRKPAQDDYYEAERQIPTAYGTGASSLLDLWNFSQQREELERNGQDTSFVKWLRDLLGDKLKPSDNPYQPINDFLIENDKVLAENIDLIKNSLSAVEEYRDIFYQSISSVDSWTSAYQTFDNALEEADEELRQFIDDIVITSPKYGQLGDIWLDVVEAYKDSINPDDILDTAKRNEFIQNLDNLVNTLVDYSGGKIDEAIKSIDDSLIVTDYSAAVNSVLLDISESINNATGIELSPLELGVKLGFYLQDDNGNPVLATQRKKQLIAEKLAEGTFDFDSLTVGELSRMTNVALELPTNQKATAEELRNRATLQSAKMRLAETNGYSDATFSIDSYLSALSIVNKTLLDNVQISQDEASVIREVIGAEADWSDAIQEIEDEVSGETKYIVKNGEALKKLIATSADATSVQGKLAKSQDKARKKYYDLTKELTKVIKSTKEYDDVTKNHIYNLSDQIADVRRLIDSYANLEQQLLGTTNAFTEFANAQELEAANTWGDQFTGFINTFADNLEKGEAGKPTTLAAIRAILPEEMRRSMTPEEQLRATVDIIEQAIADGYLSVNDDGNVEFLKENWTKFIEDGLKNGALVGTDIGHYELSDAISSLDDLAAAYGDKLSNEFLFALISKGSDFNVAGTNVLSELLNDTSDQILDNLDALTLAQEKYLDVLSDTASSASDVRSAYDDVVAAQGAVDELGRAMIDRAKMIIDYEWELQELKSELENPDIDETTFTELQGQYAAIYTQLESLGDFDQLQLSLATDQIDADIANYKEQIVELQEEAVAYRKNLSRATTETDATEATEKLADVQSKITSAQSSISNLERDRSEIIARFSNDTNSVSEELDKIATYEINDKRFKVICRDEATKSLDEVLDKIRRIRDAQINVNGHVTADSAKSEEKASHATGSFGNTYANGKANDLVGELGQEMVVNPSTGKYYTVGDNGPEMVDLPDNAIVFNAKQTKDLLRHGFTATRGRALAGGNASKQLWSQYQTLVSDRVGRGPNYVGNVDINNRPIVLNPDGSYSTTSTMFQEGWYGDEATGGYRIAHFTPILSDGTWLSDDVVGEYIRGILQQQDPMSADANGYGIVYKVDTDIDGQKITDANLQAAFAIADSWDVAMHEIQNAIYSEEAALKSRIFGNPIQRLLGNSYANGKANDLVGELGRELVVDPSTGQYYTVGDNGPEMVDLPANAIVYNAKQTEDILNGGKAFVEGNAYGGKSSGGGTGGSNVAYEYFNGVPANVVVPWRSGSNSSSSAAEAEAKDWYEAFEKAYQDLKKLRDDDVIDADEYYRRLQALYTDYYNKYGAANEENAEKLRDAWKQMYEDEKSDLEDQHNNNEIGTREYLDRLRNLYKRFYKDIPGFAKEAARAQKEYLNTLKGEYDKLFSAAVSIIGNRIDAIQEEYDAAVEAVEKERDEVNKEFDRQIKAIDNQIKGYEKQIKAVEKQVKVYQKEIEAIQKDNEARQDAIDLQKAQYELARAQNQRTQHVYTSEKGFVYRANPQDVREAQNNLEDKQQELRIKTIQKEVDKLEEVIEGYNEKIDLLNEEKEHIQELKEASDEYYDSVLEGLKNTYEPMIKHFEEMQKMWQTFIDAEELAENIGVLETFGKSVDDILNTTSGDIGAVKDKYSELLAALYADNPEMLSAFSQLYGVDLKGLAVDIDSLGTSIDGFGDHLTGMAHPWGETMEQLAHIPEELRQTVVDQAGQVFEEGQQPIDQYIKYILSFEEELRKMGGTIGDFWDESGKLREGINQEAFEVYVESWNALNEAMQEAPGNMSQVSPLLQSIKDSTLTPDQVMNYTSWLNEMNAGMPSAAESMGVMADNMASLSGTDISGVTGKMGEMLADSNVTNALSLSQSLPGVADGIAAMDGANLSGALSLSDILSESNALNASTLGTNLGTVATGVNDISGTDLNNANAQMATMAGNATGMSDLATSMGEVSNALTGINTGTALNDFNQFATDFVIAANKFKSEVQAIFNGGGGGDAQEGTNQNTGEQGNTGGGTEGGGGGWFDGFVESAKQMQAEIAGESAELEGDAVLPVLRDAFENFRSELDTIVGTLGGGEGGEGGGDAASIVGILENGEKNIAEILGVNGNEGGWLGDFTELLGDEGSGLSFICPKITSLVEEMCTSITTACENAAKAISGLLEATGGIAEADGTTDYSVLHGHTHLRYWEGERGYKPNGVDGTAHANGTALASGRWGLPSNQRGTLVGELGPETLIRNGRYTVIGATGPERLNLKKGDIILNHKQTEQVFKYGRATGRGKAYASGTANNFDGLVKSSTPSFLDKFVNIVRDIGSDIKVMKPELHHIELAVAGAGAGAGGFGSTTTNTIENINVSLPNFNSSKADDLINDLQSLSLQAIQRFNRK